MGKRYARGIWFLFVKKGWNWIGFGMVFREKSEKRWFNLLKVAWIKKNLIFYLSNANDSPCYVNDGHCLCWRCVRHKKRSLEHKQWLLFISPYGPGKSNINSCLAYSEGGHHSYCFGTLYHFKDEWSPSWWNSTVIVFLQFAWQSKGIVLLSWQEYNHHLGGLV